MKLKPVTAKEMPFVEALYEEAFPPEERRPMAGIRRAVERGMAEMLVLCDEDETLHGLVITARSQRGDVLLDFFAVDATQRGGGVGSEALRLLRERYAAHSFVLEIERPDAAAPNAEQRARRRAFYLRGGMQPTGMFTQVLGVEMEVLAVPGELSYDRYHRIYEDTYGGQFAAGVWLSELPAPTQETPTDSAE